MTQDAKNVKLLYKLSIFVFIASRVKHSLILKMSDRSFFERKIERFGKSLIFRSFSFFRSFWKSKRAIALFVALLKRAKKSDRSFALFKRATKKSDRSFALLQRAIAQPCIFALFRTLWMCEKKAKKERPKSNWEKGWPYGKKSECAKTRKKWAKKERSKSNWETGWPYMASSSLSLTFSALFLLIFRSFSYIRSFFTQSGRDMASLFLSSFTHSCKVTASISLSLTPIMQGCGQLFSILPYPIMQGYGQPFSILPYPIMQGRVHQLDTFF